MTNVLKEEERVSKSPVLLEVIDGPPPFVSKWAFVIFAIILSSLFLGSWLVRCSYPVKATFTIIHEGTIYDAWAALSATDIERVHVGQHIYVQLEGAVPLSGMIISVDSLIVRVRLLNYNGREEKQLKGVIITKDTRLVIRIIESFGKNKFN